MNLRRELGLAAVAAIVVGDILGSGIFYTPGELSAYTQVNWHIYFIWIFCGLIVLFGTLTIAELSVILPRAGATYHMIREGWGPFWGFLKIWMEMWVSGPGSVAGIGVLFGAFLSELLGPHSLLTPPAYGSIAIVCVAAINLLGVRWGGRTQVILTLIKVFALLLLIGAGLAAAAPPERPPEHAPGGILPFLSFLGLSIAAVLYTYDGWIDVTHVAGEVRDPARNLTRGLILGVVGVIAIYLLANFAFLRVVPLSEMRANPAAMANLVAERAFGSIGSRFLNVLMIVSILGSMGGLILTLPRLFYAGALDIKEQTSPGSVMHTFFGGLATVNRRTAVPVGSILFCAAISIIALFFFQTFNRIVSFFVVSAQTANILAVSSIFKLPRSSTYRMPGYPVVPGLFVGTMILLLLSVVIYQPVDSAIGIGLTCSGIPVYVWLKKRGAR